MKLSGIVIAALLISTMISTAAMAADKPAAKPKPCPKGQVTTTSKITGGQVCFAMQGMIIGPMQPVTRPMSEKKPATP